jgi:hypothetical protein
LGTKFNIEVYSARITINVTALPNKQLLEVFDNAHNEDCCSITAINSFHKSKELLHYFSTPSTWEETTRIVEDFKRYVYRENKNLMKYIEEIIIINMGDGQIKHLSLGI